MNKYKKKVLSKAKKIKLLLTDCDGVLTDTGIYYSDKGEELKRFSFRDGMGVERLRELCKIETGIITGENTQIVKRRAEKLKISEVYLGVKDKSGVIAEIIHKNKLDYSEVAFIGDDLNDFESLKKVGLSACPNDAITAIKKIVDYKCENKGGFGAFRDFAELIIFAKNENTGKKIIKKTDTKNKSNK
jgi:3-deoxy-D-manno-octulosonate 8-phosphate phosphatase (KDO 8-P phosphatase)